MNEEATASVGSQRQKKKKSLRKTDCEVLVYVQVFNDGIQRCIVATTVARYWVSYQQKMC